MRLGSLAATAIAPIDWVGWLSKMGCQVRPASSVFHTPPLTAPTQKTFGCEGTPTTARVRPPRSGPIMRHSRSAYTAPGAGAADAAGAAALPAARARQMTVSMASGHGLMCARAANSRSAILFVGFLFDQS